MNYWQRELENTIEELYFIADMSVKEISQELEIPVSEIKKILKKII